MIYHIAPRSSWETAKALGEYTSPSLDTEGFIHASALDQILGSANRHFHGRTGLVLLSIDPNRVRPEVRYDPVVLDGEQTEFPHIYGPLNIDAVVEVIDFPPDENGSFSLPAELTRRS